MTRLAALPLLALCLAVATTQAAAPPVADPDEPAARALDQKVLAQVKKDTEVMKNLTHLSDEIGPRLTGSASLNKAAEWAAAKMKEYGLSNVHLEPWTIPEGWERGKAVARVVEPDNGRQINLASLGWYPGTKGKITADVVLLKASTTKELEAYKGKLKGAIVLAGSPAKLASVDKLLDPSKRVISAVEPRSGGRTSFGEQRALMAARRELLQKEKAAAILMDSPKPFGLVVTTGSWLSGDRASATNRIPNLYVAHNHYEMLCRLASRPSAKTRMELDVENKFVPGPIKVFNVVGEIKGSEKPDEYVILGAHLDSWDLGQGTLDNGTGSCVILEAARALAKSGIKPKRTIRFVLFTGEEQGLYGSRHHVTNNKEIMSKVSACFVHDTGTGRVKGVGCGGRAAVQAILQRELVSLKEIGVTDFTSPSGGGSDHQSFGRVGVPAFMMVQESGGYVFAHHTPADSLDAAKEADLIQGAQTLAVSALRVANLKTMMPRGGGRR
jgi:carboxypeptidase Q